MKNVTHRHLGTYDAALSQGIAHFGDQLTEQMIGQFCAEDHHRNVGLVPVLFKQGRDIIVDNIAFPIALHGLSVHL